MQKSVNFKFLAVFLVVLVVCGIGVYFLHAFQVKRSAQALLEQAEHDLAAIKDQTDRPGRIARMEKADLSFARYLTFRQDDVEANVKRAILLDDLSKEQGTPLRAFNALGNVLKLDGRADLRRRYVDNGAALGEFAKIKPHVEWLLARENPQAGEDEYLLGRCEEADKKYEEALQHYEKSIALSKKVESYARLAEVYHEIGPKDGEPPPAELAVKKLKEMVEDHPTSARAYLERARYRLKHAEKDKEALAGALEDIQIARKLADTDPEVLLVGAEILTRLEKRDDAGAWLRDGLKAHPTNVRFHVALLTHEARGGNFDAALKIAAAGLTETPERDRHELRRYQADILISRNKEGDLQKAGEIIDTLRAAKYAPGWMDYLQARIHVIRREWGPAERLLRPIRPHLGDTPVLAKQVDHMLGLCYENLGNPDQGLHAFEAALKADPSSLPARFGLAKALLATGKDEEALEHFRLLIGQPNAPPATHLVLARALLLKNLRLPADKREWAELDDQLAKADEKLKKSPEVTVFRAEVLLLKDPKNLEAARDILNKALAEDRDQVEYWVGLANLAARDRDDKNLTKAFALLADAEQREKLSDPVALTLARIRFSVRFPRAEAQQKLTKISIPAEMPAEQRVRLLAGLAEAYYSIGEIPEAKILWRKLADAQPNNLAVRLLLYDLEAAGGKDGKMADLLKEIELIEGEQGTYWRYGRASRAVRQARPNDKKPLTEEGKLLLAEAGHHLSEIRKRRTSWYRVPALEAEIKEIEGRTEEAVQKYREALALGDKRPWTIRSVVILLNTQDRYKEAGEILKNAALSDAEFIRWGLGKAIVERMIMDKEFGGALEIAVQVAPPDSKDFRDQIWLGRVYQELKQLDKAKECYVRACDLNPQAPECWIYYVRYLMTVNQKKEAEEALLEAEKKLDPERKAMGLALGYEAVLNLPKAEQFHLEALKAKPADLLTLQTVVTFFQRTGQLARTEPYLRTLVAQGKKEADPVIWPAWARRSLAVTLALTYPGNHRKLEEAKTLLDENDKKPLQPVDDQRARALIMATHPAYRAEAIELHHKLPGLDSAERLRLAQLYDAAGKWPEASVLLARVHKDTEKDKNALYYSCLVYYARGLLRNDKNAAEVRKILTGVPAEAAKSLAIKELEARTLKAEGKGPEAVKLLTQHAYAMAAELGPVAGLLDQLGYPEAAEPLFRELVQKTPSAPHHLAFAEFLARRERFDDALQQCEQALALGSPERVASVSAAVLRASKTQKQLFAPVEKLLQGSLQKSTNPVPVLLAIADVRDQQRNYPESIKCYEAVLQINKEHVVALNNLAWVLAYSGGDKKRALELVERALDILGPLPELLDTRGTIYWHLDRAGDAVADLEKAVAISGTPVRQFHLAQAHLKMLNREEAQLALQKALDAGLTQAQLHPLEQAAFRELRQELLKN